MVRPTFARSFVFGASIAVFASLWQFGCTEGVTTPQPAPVQTASLETDPALAVFAGPGDDRVTIVRAKSVQQYGAAGLKEFAGADYATCPVSTETDLVARWPDSARDDLFDLHVTLGQRGLYLTQSQCGVWMIDAATAQRVSLVAPASITNGSVRLGRWGTVEGILWDLAPLVVAEDGDGMIACFTVPGDPTSTGMSADDIRRSAHVELWRLDGSGALLELLYSPTTEDRLGTGTLNVVPTRCDQLLATTNEVVWSAEDDKRETLIFRLDRGAKRVSHLTSDSSPPRDISGLTMSDTDLFYIAGQVQSDNLQMSAQPIMRMGKDGSNRRVIVGGTKPTAPVRYRLKLHGDRLYWIEGYALKRATLEGNVVDTLLVGTKDAGVFMDYAFVGSNIYFQWSTETANGTTYDLKRLPL